jgi:hypothetical protein
MSILAVLLLSPAMLKSFSSYSMMLHHAISSIATVLKGNNYFTALI